MITQSVRRWAEGVKGVSAHPDQVAVQVISSADGEVFGHDRGAGESMGPWTRAGHAGFEADRPPPEALGHR